MGFLGGRVVSYERVAPAQAFMLRHLLADTPGDHSREAFESLTPNPRR